MELIRCPAPLPEGSADPVLTRMLAPAPYQMPVKEGKAERNKDGPHPEGVPDKIPSSEDKNDGEVNVSSPPWEEKGRLRRLGGKGS